MQPTSEDRAGTCLFVTGCVYPTKDGCEVVGPDLRPRAHARERRRVRGRVLAVGRGHVPRRRAQQRVVGAPERVEGFEPIVVAAVGLEQREQQRLETGPRIRGCIGSHKGCPEGLGIGEHVLVVGKELGQRGPRAPVHGKALVVLGADGGGAERGGARVGLAHDRPVHGVRRREDHVEQHHDAR